MFCLGACNESDLPRDTVISGLESSFPIGRNPDLVDQEFLFYAGASAATVALTIDLDGASSNCPLTALAGSGTQLGPPYILRNVSSVRPPMIVSMR
jgi:hypothetical protein